MGLKVKEEERYKLSKRQAVMLDSVRNATPGPLSPTSLLEEDQHQHKQERPKT
jgi:hypothetical protein